jgi:hypothetical protein
LYIGIDSEIVREGMGIEGRETIKGCNTCGGDGNVL